MEPIITTPETPATPAAALPPADARPTPPGVGKSVSKRLASNRAAALAVEPPSSEPAPAPDVDEPVVPTPAEGDPPKPADPPKPEEKTTVDPMVQARMMADRLLQGERKKLDERERTLATREAELEKAPKGDDAAKVHRAVAADIVEYADQQKWTPRQRYEMAQALGWSSQPEDKRPAGWKGSGQGQVLSEVDQLRQENAKLAEKMTSWEKSQEETRAKAETEAHHDEIGSAVLKALPADGLKYARGFAEHAPQVARRELATLAQEMVEAERTAAEREYRDPKQVTAPAVLAEYDKRWKEALERNYGWAFKLGGAAASPASAAGAPKVPSAKETASPSSNRPPGKLSREERRKLAMADE